MNRLRLLARYHTFLAHMAVLLLIALPLFGHLDEAPVQVWDEMRNAQSALEMNETGRLIVTTFDFRPETWNTKPPLMIWILAISQRILGYNELAIRLPSAIAAALTCLLILRFARRRTGRWLPGIIAVIILVSTKGYVAMHGTRTGDYDTLLTLFTTASVVWLVNYIEDGGDRRWLYAATLALVAAVLTKGVAGLLIGPAMLIYVLARRKADLLFRRKSFYACLAGAIGIIGGYYLLREAQQPGYLALVANNELGGRFNGSVENHGGDFRTYFNELIYSSFLPWTIWTIPAVLAAFFTKSRRLRQVAGLCGLVVLSILLILSSAATKLPWYMMPVYPFLALFCAIPVFQLMKLLAQWNLPRRFWTFNFLPLLLLLFIAWAPYGEILERTVQGKYAYLNPQLNDAGIYLKEAVAGDRELPADLICGDVYPLSWYRSVRRIQGRPLPEVRRELLAPGWRVMTWEEDVKSHIRRRYRSEEVETFQTVTIFRILSRVVDSAGHLPPSL